MHAVLHPAPGGFAIRIVRTGGGGRVGKSAVRGVPSVVRVVLPARTTNMRCVPKTKSEQPHAHDTSRRPWLYLASQQPGAVHTTPFNSLVTPKATVTSKVAAPPDEHPSSGPRPGDIKLTTCWLLGRDADIIRDGGLRPPGLRGSCRLLTLVGGRDACLPFRGKRGLQKHIATPCGTDTQYTPHGQICK